ncbi:MAG: hypothetical protein KJZ91_12535, partial [Myxococcales bacterium]|nr:hypothetical protein [Myxococcales bacterium]
QPTTRARRLAMWGSHSGYQTSREARGQQPLTPSERFSLGGGPDVAETARTAREESRRRQIELLRCWFATYVQGATDAATVGDLEDYIMRWLRQYYDVATRAR